MQDLSTHPVVAALVDVAVEEAGGADRLAPADAAVLVVTRAFQIAELSDLDIDGALTRALRPSVVRGMVRLVTVGADDPRMVPVPVADLGRILAEVGQVARLAFPSGGSEFPRVGVANLIGDIALELGNGIAEADGPAVQVRLPMLGDVRTAFTVGLEGIATHGWTLDLESDDPSLASGVVERIAAAFSAQILRCDALAATA